MSARIHDLHHHPPLAAITPAPAGADTPLGEPDPDAVPLLASRDYSRLKALVHHRLGLADPVGRMLADKLGTCRVVPPDAVPGSVAVLGARIVLAIPGRTAESRVLVMPEEHAASGWTLPVSAPLGAALLGASAGQWVEVEARDGRRMAVHLLTVHRRSGLPWRAAPSPAWPGRSRMAGGPTADTGFDGEGTCT